MSSYRVRNNKRTNSRPHGKKEASETMLYLVELYEEFPNEKFAILVRLLRERYGSTIPERTLRNWWNIYLDWDMFPHEYFEFIAARKRRFRNYKRSKVITQQMLEQLKDIIEDNPDLYVDEIQAKMCIKHKVWISERTLRRALKEELKMVLKVSYDSARQRDEAHRQLFKEALKILVQHPNQLVFVDETHKDRNASRRRRAWSRKGIPAPIQRWFRNEACYTLIAAFNIEGFMDSTLDCVLRGAISNEGAAGTVNAEYFEEWVEACLCPTLGNYSKGEPNSIVVLDNASTHMHSRVRRMIESKGALILYTAPYSPDLNPIELGFGLYKSNLKRVWDPENLFGSHSKAISQINGDHAIKFFRHCGVPKSDEVLTIPELEELVLALNLNE